jgi:hypothetical protein
MLRIFSESLLLLCHKLNSWKNFMNATVSIRGSPSDEGVAGDKVFLCSFESFTRLCHESCGAASDRTPSLVSDPPHPRA